MKWRRKRYFSLKSATIADILYVARREGCIGGTCFAFIFGRRGESIAIYRGNGRLLHFTSEARMSADAKLYEVVGRHGTVYAIHDIDNNMFWSERTEQA